MTEYSNEFDFALMIRSRRDHQMYQSGQSYQRDKDYQGNRKDYQPRDRGDYQVRDQYNYQRRGNRGRDNREGQRDDRDQRDHQVRLTYFLMSRVF